jgi:hypothetical protein
VGRRRVVIVGGRFGACPKPYWEAEVLEINENVKERRAGILDIFTTPAIAKT